YSYINQSDDPILKAKSTLYITTHRGAVIKECPGTSEYTCCDYTILHTGTFCTMDCSYCILQAYFHPPVLQYFAGFDRLETALNDTFKQDKIFRIGTGEFTDSLIWEKISLLPEFLINIFAKQDNCILELKTKTVNIDSLLDLDHNNKTILSWSLNTPHVIHTEERGTTSLNARLQAAQKAQGKGYPLAFHFDPLVIYPGCENEYEQVIKLIFDHVDPQNIVWISIGSFRFMPALKPIIEKRFSDSVICYGEFICGLDNKMRYFKPVRIRLYQKIISCIQQYAPKVLVYFCMEDEQVWNECMGFFPAKEGELGTMLDKSAGLHCNLNPRLL
ncbi:MAG: DNA photolyase, partial [Proteobacteria bacterium]|nr:DNA photolyase [Pseudomonadota bacterium]